MDLAFYKKGELHYSIGFFLLFILILALWQWMFAKTLNVNYLSKCIKLGPLVLIFNAIIAAIWSGFNHDRGLISANPKGFIQAWFAAGARIALAFSNVTRRPQYIFEEGPPKLDIKRENLFCNIVFTIVAIIIIPWIIIVSPFLYFVFFISASPVRLALRIKDAKHTRHGPVMLKSNKSNKDEEAKDNEYITFDENPVASAFALSSLILLVARTIMDKFSSYAIYILIIVIIFWIVTWLIVKFRSHRKKRRHGI